MNHPPAKPMYGKAHLWPLALVFVLLCASALPVQNAPTDAPPPAPQGTDGAANPTPAELPTLADGPGKGFNNVYQGRFYDATLDAKARLEIQPKDKGVPTGKPIVIVFGCHYYDPAKKNTVPRPIVAFTTRPQPKVSDRPGIVKLAGLFADEVRFTFVVEFTEKGVSVEGEIKDPAGLTPASNLGYHAQVQPTHNPPREMELEQIKTLMPGWTLVLTAPDNKRQTIPYWKSLNSQPVERAQIRGPWGNREVTVKAPAVTQARTKARSGGYLAVYPGMAAYNGFYIGRAGTSDQLAGELSVTLD